MRPIGKKTAAIVFLGSALLIGGCSSSTFKYGRPPHTRPMAAIETEIADATPHGFYAGDALGMMLFGDQIASPVQYAGDTPDEQRVAQAEPGS